MLLVSIIRTIITNPGNIPEEKEWDMNTDSQADGESAPENQPQNKAKSEQFTNEMIQHNKEYPQDL